jgi:hypothetical protein
MKPHTRTVTGKPVRRELCGIYIALAASRFPFKFNGPVSFELNGIWLVIPEFYFGPTCHDFTNENDWDESGA